MTDKTQHKDTQKKRSTLSIGGTLSSTGSSRPSEGVAIEVKRRRFDSDTPAKKTLAAQTESTGDAELDRRMQALKIAQENATKEQERRENERKQAAELQKMREEEEANRKAKAAEDELRKIQAEQEKARANVNAARGKKAPVAAQSAPQKAEKTLSLGEQFKRKNDSRKSDDNRSSAGGKKRGRNAYLGDIEQRYRAMSSHKRRGDKSGRGADSGPKQQAEKIIREVEIGDFITVGDLAARMSEKAGDVVKKLMLMGEMATVNETLDQDTAVLLVEEFGHKYKLVSETDIEVGLVADEDDAKDLVERSPVVTVMGHVDHGKTTLLDALRKTDVVGGEAGGITQHIGAYQVTVPSGRKITFLDTPGHAAFTAMRARGAKVTDIVILVVAADDGVMPQTIEAIQHAKAAEVPIVVAINKSDKPEANPQRVKNELLSHELVLEEFGGDVPVVEVSALKGMGLNQLEEVLLLQADLLELKANPTRRADGIIVESRLDKGRGPIATVVVQRGTLHTGDIIVAGAVWGRVRALINDKGETVKEAGPSVPVEILGLQGVPEAGDTFVIAESDRKAKEVAAFRDQKLREKAQASRKLSLDNMFERMESADVVELNVIVKADVQGSVEAIAHSLKQLNTSQVKVRVVHGGVGVIAETDVNLAIAAQAIIVGFNVRADANARKIAEHEGVELRYYTIIYELIDDIKNAMSGLLAPDYEEDITGSAEIRAIFKMGKNKIAGCMVTDGKLERNSKMRLLRDGKVVHQGAIASIRREKDDVKEIASGYECGITLDNFNDIAEGDIIEGYVMKEVTKTLDDIKKEEKAAKANANG